MARPTRAEQEKKRIEALRAEGKGPNGEPIEDAQIISETKTEPKKPLAKGDFNIADLEADIENSTLGNGGFEKPKVDNTNIESGDFGQPDKDDPDYISTTGHDRFKEPIIENESDANKAATQPTAKGPAGGNETKDFAEPIIEGAAPTVDAKVDDGKAPPPVNPDFDKLSPTQKRAQVELFADTILTTYAQLLPIVPTLLCSYNMNKMELLDKDGVIRLSMTVNRSEGGELQLREVFTNFNEEVAGTFVITNEMKEELRPSLIEVLMERGIAPTPMMTLLIGVARHALLFGIAAVKLMSTKNQQLEIFKEFRKEEIAMELEKHKAGQHNPTKTPPPPPVAEKVEVPNSEPEKKSEGTISMQDAMNSDIKAAVEAKKGQLQQESQSGITIEEVIDDKP